MSYLPKQLSMDEILEKGHKGLRVQLAGVKLMPVAIKELKGMADGKAVKEAVEKVLGAN